VTTHLYQRGTIQRGATDVYWDAIAPNYISTPGSVTASICQRRP